jgi:hypothetical protein
MNNVFRTFIWPLIFFASINFVFASQSNGTILSSTYSTALVCQDNTCSPSLGHRINFKPTIGSSGISPITIDDSNGIKGMAWGEKLGWVNFSQSGTNTVKFSDTSTGSTTGYAWSQTAGYINFAPTGYGVKINSSGEFQGYAWVGGSDGGWIKFDCSGSATTTCVKTDWIPVPYRTIIPSGGGGGGGGGGGFVVPPSTTTPATNVVNTGSASTTQSGPQNQKNGDYSNEYRSDIDDSGIVDIFDFNLLLVNWNKSMDVDLTTTKLSRCMKGNIADVNCNGKVDIFDFNLLLIYWGSYVGDQGQVLKIKQNKK